MAWAVVQPLAGMALLAGVFGGLAGLPSDGLPYAVFAFVGVLCWNYVAASVNDATSMLVENPDLVTKVYFPRLIAPLSAVLAPLVDLGISLVILAILMAVLGVAPGPALVLAPVVILLLWAVALGASLWLSALNIQYRDVRQALQFLLQLWFFASPVAYASSLIDESWRWAYYLNPAAGVIDLARWSFAGAAAPGWEVLVSVATTVVLLTSAVIYYGRVQALFADVI